MHEIKKEKQIEARWARKSWMCIKVIFFFCAIFQIVAMNFPTKMRKSSSVRVNMTQIIWAATAVAMALAVAASA